MISTITVYPADLLQQIKLSYLIPSLTKSILTRKIISQEAEKQGIKVELNELQQCADGLRLVNKLQSAQETWLWLEKHSLSLNDFEELASIAVISSKLAQHFFDNQVEPFFIEHQLDYTQVVMYEVLLEDEDLAMELFYAIQEGEINFHQVAHEYIQDKELRRAGGYRGLLYRNDLKPEISSAVFAATPPTILKPIITSKGAYLILLEDLVRLPLDEDLRSKILLDLFSKWVEQQIEQVETILEIESSKNQFAEPVLT